MSQAQDPLFRREVLEQRTGRLYADVHLPLPVGWHVMGTALLASVLAGILFLSLGSYSRYASVTGTIVPDLGLAAIVPTRSGVITAVRTREGQRVKAGAPLIDVRTEEAMADGDTGPIRSMDALKREDATLAAQSAETLTAGDADRSRLVQQASGLSREIADLDEQIADQRRLVQVADLDFNTYRSVAERGFVSKRDLRSREEALLVRRQQLSQLRQTREAKASSLIETSRAASQAEATARAQAAGLESSRAGVAQRLADVAALRGYTLTSPVDGMATAVTARVGQAVGPQSSLMILVPDGAKLLAELYVPTTAAAFLRPGQKVRLAVDAFPYQRFGTVDARVSAISTAATPHAGPSGTMTPVYLLTAELSRQGVPAFGREQPLLPGMAVNARILTERRSLLRVLFEPLFSVSRR